MGFIKQLKTGDHPVWYRYLPSKFHVTIVGVLFGIIGYDSMSFYSICTLYVRINL